MRRISLIILGALVLAWAVAAIVTGSPSLESSSSKTSTTASTAPAVSGPSPACLPKSINHSAALPDTRFDVTPAPETDSANPDTQISFLGAPASQISDVSVSGARSGSHSGKLESYSQGDGASFVPSKAFDAGEQVTVKATLSGRQVSYRFQVDVPFPTAGEHEFANPSAAPGEYEAFDTLPGAQPPLLTVTSADRDPAAGDVFTTNGPGPGQYGPLIYTPQGRLVWFDHLPAGETAEDLNVQSYEGDQDLTWWRGRVLAYGFGQGEDIIMNSHYDVVAHVKGGNGLKPDLHEFQLAPHDVAYVTVFNPMRCDLTAVKGSREGTITDAAIQEVDIKTGLVRWEWHAIDHVAASESEVETPSSSFPWDWFHINSIDLEEDGNILISARNTWAAYQLEGGSGRILWRLGGLKSSFKMGPGTKTAWQHDARMLPDGDVTVYDDGANPPIHGESRAIRIALDASTHEARLVSSLTHPGAPLLAASQGNMQTLASGNTVVGYGAVPEVTEYSSSGSVLFDAHLPYEMVFYRAYRHPWSGQPAAAPAVLANLNNTGEETIVHASWNGATDVSSWRVLAGKHSSELATRTTIPVSGFESSISLPVHYGYVQVQALGSAGQVLGTSATVKPISFHAALKVGA